jgi:DNA repair/transcription protein MET18/MMS19
MIAVLANKYQPSPSTFTFKQVVQFWRDRIVQDLPSWNPPTQVMLTFDIGRVLDILIGAARRQEKEVLGLIPFVHKLLGIPDFPGDAVAEEMGRLIGEEEVLQSEGHAVIKPLYRQWVYAHVVKPMYEHAFPIKSDASEAVTTAAERHTAAILLMLKHCPFAVYEPDTDRLVSMILVVLKTMHEGEFTRLALGLLHEIMRNDHKALRYHIRAIIDALTEVYKAHLGPPKATAGTENKELEHIAASKKDKRPLSKAAACRREALEMLGDMAELFEDRYIMPFRGTMNQFLNSCCGDPVRELRWIAHQSRDKWFGL